MTWASSCRSTRRRRHCSADEVRSRECQRCSGFDIAIPARQGCNDAAIDRPLQRLGRCNGVRELELCSGARGSRHKLPGPLHSNANRAPVRRVESEEQPRRSEAGDRSGLERYRVTYTDYYNANKEPDPGAARRQSVGRADSRRWNVHIREEQEGSADHGGVLCERDSRDGRSHRIGAEQRCAAAAGIGVLPQAKTPMPRPHSRASTTTLRCLRVKRSASSIGRWKKPRFSACLRSRSSAEDRPGGGRRQRHRARRLPSTGGIGAHLMAGDKNQLRPGKPS